MQIQKLLLPILVTSILIILSSCNEEQTKQELESSRAKSKLYPDEYLFRQRAYPFLEADYGNVTKSYFKSRADASFTNRRHVESWNFEGPTNINGRVVDIEGVVQADKTILYVASASGGIFKTENDGTEWTPIFDDQLTLAIGDVEISKNNPNIIYVGTGEANAGGGSLAYDGNGVYKSIDSGTTWTHLGLQSIGSVGKVAIDPTNDDIVYVAAMGKLFSNNEERGVYKTIDGGQTWEKIFFISDQTGAIDLVIDPTDPEIIYTAMWDRIRTPSNRTYGGINSGIYKTIDGGENWVRQTNLPMNDEIGRIGLSISQSDPATLYATISKSDGTQEGIYKSEDAGSIWSKKTAGNLATVPFMWWFGKIYVHPDTPSLIFHPGFDAQSSSNSGNSFTNIFQNAHVDQHAMWFHPTEPNTIYLGNDGGIYKSNNLGENHFKLPNLPNVQFYTCEIDNLNPERLYGGTQDNNTIRTFTGEQDDYEPLVGGDGFRVLVDYTNSNIIYAEYQYGNLFRSIDGGQSFQFALNGVVGSDRNNWNSPLAMAPNDPTTLYFGTHRIYKSQNGAVSWDLISNDLSKGENLNGNLRYGTTTTIDVSPYNEDYILVGTDDGNVQLTTDGGDNWSLLSASLPNRWVTAVSFDPNDSQVLYATFSGFRYGEDISNAYRSIDLGQTWTSITPNFYEGPINDILIIPENGMKVIATDIGIFTSETDSDDWELLGNELPNIVVTDIDYHVETRTLVAATFGRGLFSYEFSDPLISQSVAEDINIILYPNPATNSINISSDFKISQIEIYNIQGQKIHVGIDQQIDVSNFTKGSYYLKAQTNKGVITKGFIVE